MLIPSQFEPLFHLAMIQLTSYNIRKSRRIFYWVLDQGTSENLFIFSRNSTTYYLDDSS
jgi:hypothetical protein